MTEFFVGLIGMLRSHWRLALFLALAGYAALLHLRLGEEKMHGAKLQARLVEASMLLDRERAEVRLRTATALAQDTARAARVERDQAIISKESVSEYQSDIAAVRASAQRLHGATSTADPNSRGGKNLPGFPGTSGRADGASCENQLHAGDALIASEIALRLKALQSWLRQQSDASAKRPGD